MIKPLKPIINWQNPLTKGLVFDEPILEGGGTISIDLVSRNQGNFQGSNIGWTKDVFGNVFNITDTASYSKYMTVAPQAGVTNISLQAVVYGTTNAANLTIVTTSNTAAGTTGWQLRTDSAQTAYAFINADWTNVPGWGAPATSYKINKWQNVIVTQNDLSNAATTPIFYIDGTKYTTYSFSVSPTGSYTNQDGQLRIGANRTGSAGFQGKIALIRYWNRILSDAEAFQLFTDPWRIYYRPGFLQPLNSIAAVASTVRYWRSLMGIGS